MKLLSSYTIAILICSALCNAQQTNRQPNIIFIFSDDLSFRDLSCYGQKNFQTPNIDALSASSVRFTQAYAAAPECAPSRACMLTGMHVGNSPVKNNSSARGFEPLPDSVKTFGHVLQQAGYVTGVVGKWGLGNLGTTGEPNKQGFDYHFGYLSHYEAHSYFPWSLYENGEEIALDGNHNFTIDFLYDKEKNSMAHDYEAMYNAKGKLIVPDPEKRVYAPDLMDDMALNFISINKTKPFLLYFTTNLPHGPAIVDDMRSMTGRKDMDINSREWAAMVLRLDISVGKIINKLKAEGLYENTVIVFASDNGYSMHNLKKDTAGNNTWPDDTWLHNKGAFDGGKFSAREGGMRIPFFIHMPGQSTGRVETQPVWLVDVLPTFAALAKTKITTHTDGYSLLPLLQNNASGIPYNRPMYFFKQNEQAVRMGPWFARREAPDKPLALYLLDEDQDCSNNLAQYYPQQVKVITEYLAKSHKQHPWYWNPGETAEDFARKKKLAAEEGLLVEELRPNGMKKMPWEN